jgi:hypothetical protein
VTAETSETRPRSSVTVPMTNERPDVPGTDNPEGREPMSDNNQAAAKEEPVAPKPGRGFTVVELRTTKQAEIVKGAVKGLPAGSFKIEDRWVVVKNTEAQAAVDKAIAGFEKLSMFEGRVVTYFLAELLLANSSTTDSRTSLHSRLIQVGRSTKGFEFVLKGDGTIGVKVGSKEYATQKAAMEALAPDQLKAPKPDRSTAEGRTAAEDKAKAKNESMERAKAQGKALREWEAKPEAERGPRPPAEDYDALAAVHDAKEAAKAKEAEARAAEKAEAAAAKKTATAKEVTPNLKAANARKAS